MGLINSARIHCSQLTKSTIADLTKKIKKREKRRGETQTSLSLQSKRSHYHSFQASHKKINMNPNDFVQKI